MTDTYIFIRNTAVLPHFSFICPSRAGHSISFPHGACADMQLWRPLRPEAANHSSVINDEFEDENNNLLAESSLTELRIVGPKNIFSKVFVDESLTCDSPIEPHLFYILIYFKQSLPCSHCGEVRESKLSSKMTDETFPLCKACEQKG